MEFISKQAQKQLTNYNTFGYLIEKKQSRSQKAKIMTANKLD